VSREWKPGDVAERTYLGNVGISLAVHGCLISQHGYGLHWHHANGGWDSVDGQSSYRPLVVIDPDDFKQVERLLTSLQGMSFASHACGAFSCLQAALREFANPTPPKPDEPTGLGAVVENSDGGKWVRTDAAVDRPWWRYPGITSGWAQVDAVRVLSEGVS